MFTALKKPAEHSDPTTPYSIIGGFIVFTAVLIYLMGLGCTHVGNLSKARYEKSTGVFIRNISAADSKNYEDSKTIIIVGHYLKNASILILFLGLTILWKPELLYYELKWMGAVRDRE